ncbi:hypothetical protein GQ54DRAFT_131243 [Martensiomyces pterosporus]|nr:hypothetical protein GQ54DRAFT_131243 [Martensiomyces pterosporus]
MGQSITVAHADWPDPHQPMAITVRAQVRVAGWKKNGGGRRRRPALVRNAEHSAAAASKSLNGVCHHLESHGSRGSQSRRARTPPARPAIIHARQPGGCGSERREEKRGDGDTREALLAGLGPRVRQPQTGMARRAPAIHTLPKTKSQSCTNRKASAREEKERRALQEQQQPSDMREPASKSGQVLLPCTGGAASRPQAVRWLQRCSERAAANGQPATRCAAAKERAAASLRDVISRRSADAGSNPRLAGSHVCWPFHRAAVSTNAIIAR